MVRGDIHYIYPGEVDAIGSEHRDGRPAVIVSNDKCNNFSNVVEIVYLTTQKKKALPTHVAIYSTKHAPIALCEQVHSVSLQRIGDYAGRCTDKEMKAIDEALLVSLDLNMDKPIVEQHLLEVAKLEHELDVYKLMYENLLDRLFHMVDGDRNA